MIIQNKDITRFRGVKVDGDLHMKRVTNIHNPTGVFFEKYVDNETDEFLFFAVAAINDLGEIEDRQVFDGDSQESFFKAVDYFESLIEERIPEKQNEPPSIGIFCFIKSKAKKPSFVDIGLQEAITIDKEDIEKVFTPPVKKKFGRLNMLEVDKPKYDVIKSKFALSFNQQLTDQLADKFDIDKEDIFVYKLTPYQNQPQEPNQQGGQQEPEDVNDEELSLDKIEGEEPEKMKGEKEKDKNKKKDDSKKEDSDGDGDGDKDGEDSDGDGDGDKDGEDSDGDGDGDSDKDEEDSDGDGDGDSDSDKDGEDSDGDSDGDGDKDGEDSDGDSDGDDFGQDSADSEGDDNEDNRSKRKGGDEIDLDSPVDLDQLDGDFEEALARVDTDDIIQQMSNNFEVEDVVKSFRRQQRLIDSLGVYTQQQLQDKFYSDLGLPQELSKKEFIEFVKERTKPYFNK